MHDVVPPAYRHHRRHHHSITTRSAVLRRSCVVNAAARWHDASRALRSPRSVRVDSRQAVIQLFNSFFISINLIFYLFSQVDTVVKSKIFKCFTVTFIINTRSFEFISQISFKICIFFFGNLFFCFFFF